MTVMSVITPRAGARLVFNTMMLNDFESVAKPSLAVTVTVYTPASLNPGASAILPVAVPVPGIAVVTVANVGPFVFENCSGFRSASVAERA